MSTDDDLPEERSWKLVLTHPEKVHCLRQSFLTGILSGMGVGVGYFFMTSNVQKATRVGFGGYICITLGTWIYCRINNAQQRTKQKLFKKAIQQKILSEGTDMEFLETNDV